MTLTNWDEIRTAYQVARIDTVSGAAEVLGVHHATVIRHVDALEDRLGTKLFQRHARGYTATEAGRELLNVAQATDDQFSQLAARLSGAGDEMAGELIVTSVSGLSALIIPTLARLRADHPELRLRFVSDNRLLRLEYGEAHVAIRAGTRPQEPDNVVQPLLDHIVGLFASRAYLAMHGKPENTGDLPRHHFVGPSDESQRAPFNVWLASVVPDEALVFRTNDANAGREAVRAGVAIGFLPRLTAREDPDLVEVLQALPEWTVPLWIVTHVDLHRTAKVQRFIGALKQDLRARIGVK